MRRMFCLSAAVFGLALALEAIGDESANTPADVRRVACVKKYLVEIPDPVWQDRDALAMEADNIKSLCANEAPLSVLGAILAEPDADRKKVLRILALLRPQGSTEFFGKMLNEGKCREEQEIALRFLKDVRSDEAIRQIAAAAVHHVDPGARNQANEAVQEMVAGSREKVVNVLCQMVGARGATPSQSSIRKAGVILLERIPGRDVSEFLQRQMESPDASVRLAVLRALSARGELKAGETMLSILPSDPNEKVRREAACSAGRIRSESSIPDLIGALEDEDAMVRRLALRSLRKITGCSFGPSRSLWDTWWHRYSENLQGAYDLLNHGREEKVLQGLRILQNVNLNRKEVAHRVESLLWHDSPKVQCEAVIALGELGQKESIPTLLDALDTNDTKMLVLVLGTLAKMPGEKEKIADAISPFASDHDPRVAAAARKVMENCAK